VKGVEGFHDVEDTLEMVSEKKGEVDEAKGKTLQEISTIIQSLTLKINVIFC
jgi:intraflagellar transport protein 81